MIKVRMTRVIASFQSHRPLFHVDREEESFDFNYEKKNYYQEKDANKDHFWEIISMETMVVGPSQWQALISDQKQDNK